MLATKQITDREQNKSRIEVQTRLTPINSARGLGSQMTAVAAAASPCIFCQIAGKSTSTTLFHTDEKVVAFQDINPAAVRHYLVIPVDHIPTVKDLQRRPEDYSLVSHMLEVGKTLIQRDAPQCHQYRWKCIKYLSVGSIGFVEAEKLLGKIKPLPPVISKV
ncbi:hypothetical protein ACFX2I_032067 [Malus domestica]